MKFIAVRKFMTITKLQNVTLKPRDYIFTNASVEITKTIKFEYTKIFTLDVNLIFNT